MRKLLLYDLFEEIRSDKRLNRPGLQEYFSLLELLDSHYQVADLDDLLFVCQALWLKSKAEEKLFNEIFEKFRGRLGVAFQQEKRTDKDATTGTGSKGHMPKKSGPDTPAPPPDTGRKIENDIRQEKEKHAEESQLELYEEGNVHFAIQGIQNGISGKIDRPGHKKSISIVDSPYLFTTDYFPVTNRQLQQGWRKLKSQYTGNPLQLPDMPSTIRKIAREGIFTSIIYEKEVLNRLSLFIFTDQGGSMASFDEFGRELCRSATQSGLHGVVKPYSFYNIPLFDEDKNDHILSAGNGSYTLKQIFGQRNRNNIAVLIYSDAGALRGNYNEERIADTTRFIKQLQSLTAYVTWLNPLPAYRWSDTSAVAVEVPMYECNRNGFENAINSLKGKHI